MISVYRDMVRENEGNAFAVYTIDPTGNRYRLGAFETAKKADAFIAKRTKGSVYCPTHAWKFCNPSAPDVCPGPLGDKPPYTQNQHTVS